MSLFKARDWWSTSFGGEEFDKGCLCIANIDNNNEKTDKIIMGSHSGLLRIYQPRPEKQEDGTMTAFRPDELLLERHLGEPIINVASGRFVATSEQLHLAVLHPRKLSVYIVTVTPGAVDHGTHYHLSLLYEHKLQRSAYCLVVGPFGEVKGKDFMCVQSLDGTLTFFEQESFAFSRFLPGFLLPGPLIYVPTTDSFITVSAGWHLESYRFQILAVAKDPNAKEESENITHGKRVMTDWSFSIGEAALDISLIGYKTAPSIILVLGERSIFVFKQNGILKYIKKLDYSPVCFLAYHGAVESTTMMLVATHQCTLLVYRDVSLCWAAQLPFKPVTIGRGTFMTLKGMIIILSEQGDLGCCYLGTEPSLFVVPVLESRDIDFVAAEQEMYELRKIIKATNTALPGNKRMENELSISITIPHHLDPVAPNESFVLSDDGDPVPAVTAKIQVKTTVPLQDVRVMIHLQQPLVASQMVFNFRSISEFAQGMVTIQMKAPHIPSSLKLHVLATYSNSNGVPRISENSATLPLQLVAKSCTPFKNATYKVTIDTNKNTVSVHELFSEFNDPSSVSGNAIGFEFHGGQQVVVLASKTSQRYRVQSDYFAAMWLFVSELIQRLHQHFKHRYGSSNEVKFSYSSSIPLADYFSIIENHFDCRQKLYKLEELLGERAAQFRAIQKRLLTKMKDKTPTSLNNLDTLLEATHRQILSLTESIEEFTQDLEGSSCALNAATLLICLLVKLAVNLTEDNFTILTAVLSPYSDVDSDNGWEETVDIAITHMLATCLGQSGKEMSTLTNDKLEMPKDINRLKKHIAILIDRILKGARFVESNKDSQEDFNNQTNTEIGDTEETSVPIGSKFAERKDEFERVPKSARYSARCSVLPPLREIENKEMIINSDNNSLDKLDVIEHNVTETEQDDLAFF